MKKYKIILITIYSLLAFDTLYAEMMMMVLGPFSITNGSTTYYPQFPSGTGYLHSVSFEISDFNLNYDVILDNDETNALSFDVTLSRSFNISPPYFGLPFYGVVFGVTDNMIGMIPGGDDGDGADSPDGGVDEVRFSVSYSNLFGQVSSSLSSHLAYNTGSSQRGLIGMFTSAMGIPIGTNLDSYIENETYSGSLYVHYTYNNLPIIPEVRTITVSSNLLVQIDIENLSIGSSNIIQRCLELGSNDWVDVESFISSGWFTNWTEQASDEWSSAFYRVQSK